MPDAVENVSPAQRKKDFLEVFRHFNSDREAVEWIAQVTGSRPGTVWVWRVNPKRKSGYAIPYRPWKMLMDAVKARFEK